MATPSPTCPCGYNLSGLPGPPWTCPECAQVTRAWPPSEPIIPTLSPFEQRLWNTSLSALLACPLLSPWAGEFRDVGFAIAIALLSLAGLGAAIVASLFSRPDQNYPSLLGPVVRTVQFLVVFFSALFVAGVLFAISAAIRRSLTGHS